MIVVLNKNITDQQKHDLRSFLSSKGLQVHEIVGAEETVFGAVGVCRIDPREVELLPGVEKVIPISKPYKLASRELKKEDTIVSVGKVKIGGGRIVAIAGPCAVESRDQIMRIASLVRDAGAVMLRGGAFKPRTSPYSFQGLGEEGLKYLKEAGEKYDMPVTTEIVSPSNVDMMKDYVDMFQIGARNMQNFELLKAVGKTGMPVLLKRGIAATIEEWLMAAEYLMSSGTDQVVLCERGIRTYERATRNTLDCSAIPVVQKLTHLPVIGDPSHATGLRDLVNPMSLAIISSGASGIIVEVHDHPDAALSDGPQSLYPQQFEKLMRDVEALAPVVGKSLERIPRTSLITTTEVDVTPQMQDAVAFQGERGAYSELAVTRLFGEKTAVRPCPTFKDVFDAVDKGEVKYGVVPVENTLGGTIYDTLDLLALHPGIKVVGEQQVRIIHSLVVIPGTKMEDIREVYSHPQGLAQCARFLEKELPQAKPVSYYDTAGAVAFIKATGDRSKAAIAGAPAAAYHKMEVLREGIETNPSNYTRFYVICREENGAAFISSNIPNRAVMSFSVNDKPGALFDALHVLSVHKLNMKKLESRPILGKPWEYSFFIETEIPNEAAYRDVVEELKGATQTLRQHGVFFAG
ncbi:MAG: 3-deoxy-7-phosphoheptulonate synthase [Sphaerochaeta sp.]|jgi:3-deoxy-7-phosphoheptulonate synthase|nr:3-deoxy-7-phosphoheptulonate synthase [Sphaerochaeta sp.]MCI2096350.1 3-deoxy-7-phosphoheptulonate synthase [Sphaerochaeta sp.]